MALGWSVWLSACITIHASSRAPGTAGCIARAIVTDPAVLVADEPTGDLDKTSAEEVLGLIDRLNREMNKTILMVTHDPRAAEGPLVRHLEKGVGVGNG
jgi:predicted ABC-type transport system involved in lysophospholipase L1 biosynthesis ATPase subunit